MNSDPRTDWIRKRRSIRKYTGEKITDDELKELLRAAMGAPSAVNKQPWHFIVLDDRALLSQVPGFHPNASFVSDASHAIVVCVDEKLQHDEGYGLLDCSAAAENLLLAANSMDLGACWIGIYPREGRINALRDMLQTPDHVMPFAMISLGRPAEEKPEAERYRPERIHRNTWGTPFE